MGEERGDRKKREICESDSRSQDDGRHQRADYGGGECEVHREECGISNGLLSLLLISGLKPLTVVIIAVCSAFLTIQLDRRYWRHKRKFEDVEHRTSDDDSDDLGDDPGNDDLQVSAASLMPYKDFQGHKSVSWSRIR